MEGLFFCHCLVLRPEYRGREAALKHPLVRPRTQGPIHSPSQPRTQREVRAGRGLDTRRRVQQVAAASSRAPRAATRRARIMDVELSYFALLALEFETPDEDQDHELVSGARAGASGSRRWPRGGSRGGSPLVDAGRGRAAPALPPCGPHPLWAPEPLGCSSRGARQQALPAPLLPGSQVPGADGPRRPRPLCRPLLPALT